MPARWSIIIFVACLLVGLLGVFPAPRVEISWHSGDALIWERPYIPSYVDTTGTELVTVYLGSSTCGYSNDERLPDILEKVKLALRQRAAQQGRMFSAVGVAVDRRVATGRQRLEKFGFFNEVMTGQSWLGAGARMYYSKLLPGAPSTPQALVYLHDRDVYLPAENQPGTYPAVSGQTLLARK